VSKLARFRREAENHVAWFHRRATQQLVAGERGIVPFSTCLVLRRLCAARAPDSNVRLLCPDPMAKKKRRRKSPKAVAASQPPKASESTVFKKWNSRLNVFILSTSALMLICLIYAVWMYSSIDNFIHQRSPYTLAAYSIVVTELIFVKFWLDQRIGRESRRNIPKAQRLILYRGIFELVHVTVLFVPIIYISGITSSVAKNLGTWLPLVGNRLLNWLLSAVTFLFSGLVGNAGYDIAKRIFRRLRPSR
jgi:hypothetical protein